MPKIESLDKYTSVSVDFPFNMKGLRVDGVPAVSFEAIKDIIDRALSLGFDTIAFETNVPIDIQTGNLQFSVSDEWNPDRSFPLDIWKSIEYAESKGLKTILDLHIRNVKNDTQVTTSNIGAHFKKDVFFQSIKVYQTEIASKASFYGVDGIRIGQQNTGFDQGDYLADWQLVIGSIRNVYSGTLIYGGWIGDKNNALFGLVDEIQVGLHPAFSLKTGNSAKDMIPLYFERYVQGNNKLSESSLFSQLEALTLKYPDKKVSAALVFLPGQSAGRESIQPDSYIYGDGYLAADPSRLRKFPEEWIDKKLNQEKIAGFFEFLGNYAKNLINGIEVIQYTPWAEFAWMRNPDPNNPIHVAWNAAAKANYFLNWQPEAEEALSKYLQRDWGFKTLHYGSERDDAISGSDVSDTFFSSRGNDVLNGDSGLDQLVVDGKRSSFNLNKRDTGWLFEDKGLGSQNFGTDTVRSVERLKFSDVSLALDLDGNAGKAAKVLGAVFGKVALANKEYVGIGLSLLDSGMSYEALAALAVSAAKKSSATDICNLLWTNVIGTTPTAGDIAPFKSMLDSGQLSVGALTTLAADTSYNTTNINLVGLASTGIEYI